MLFGRRQTEPLLVKLRVTLWPRRSWSRSLRYARLRFGRLQASPHSIALGLAVGVFVAFQPIIGFQMLAAGALACLVRGSVGAALLGTFVGGPLTWPVMWLASYHVGAYLIGDPHQATLAEIWSALMGLAAIASPEAAAGPSQVIVRHVLYPLAAGALPIGLMAAAAIYAMVLRIAGPGRRLGRQPH